MPGAVTDDELEEIGQRAARAFAVAPTPWIWFLETRHGIGGEVWSWLGSDPVLDRELYISLYAGSKRMASPDVGLDAVVDFIAHAHNDIPSLIAEIRRLRTAQL